MLRTIKRLSSTKEYGSHNSPKFVDDVDKKLNKPFFIKICVLLQVITIIGCCMVFLAHCFTLLYTDLSAVDSILRCYGGVITIVALLSEVKFPLLVRNFLLMESWLFKGLYLIFNGVLVLTSEENTVEDSKIETLNWLAAYWSITVGVLYFMFGLLCFRAIKERHLRRIRQREKLNSEMGELAEKRDEIERLLSETEIKLNHL